MFAEQVGSIQEAIEPTARRFPEMQAGHARSPSAPTAGVEGAPRFAGREILKEAVERRLEYRLETSQNEVPARCRIDHEGKMVWQQILRETVPLDPGESCEAPDSPMGIRMKEGKKVAPKSLVLLLCRVWNLDTLQQSQACGSSVGNRHEVVAEGDEVFVYE